MPHSGLFTASPLHSWCTPHFKLNPHLACEQALHFGCIMRRQESAAPERRIKCEGIIPSFHLSLAFSCSLFRLHSKWRTYLLTNLHPLYFTFTHSTLLINQFLSLVCIACVADSLKLWVTSPAAMQAMFEGIFSVLGGKKPWEWSCQHSAHIHHRKK